VAIQLISVGLSIREGLRNPARWMRNDPGLADAISRERPDELLARAGAGHDLAAANAWLAVALASPDAGREAAELSALVKGIRPDRWPPAISGELKTLARIPGAGYPLSVKDTAVLIGSDTLGGLSAGLWNAIALTGGDVSRVRYLARPDLPPGPVRGCAVVVRVPGLDAGDEEGFRRAMGGLGALGRNLVRSGDLGKGEPFSFCLTGGFKATMPYLIGLAEGLRSLDSGHPVNAFILHETAAPQAPPIRLPLRRLIASQVEQELSGFDRRGMRATKPSPSLLDGYAYEAANGRCELTAFGEGLRALFGVAPERAGG
jgi:hypothetical protein